MVGVPGKSKGCSTCRRRKKGCDQKRPVCGQCTSSGYVCGGYQRDRTFILHPASKAVERAIFLPHPRYSASSLISQSLDRAAIDAQCRSLFWDLYMPHGDCVCRDEVIVKCNVPMNWTEIIHELPNNESSLENAFSALSLSRVGKDKKDSRLLKAGNKLYGKALKDMQTALYDRERMHSDQVLTAIMLLSLYEVFEGTNVHAQTWLSHAQGAARLIQLRGPQRHISRQAHHVFLGSRMPTIYAAILRRQATYLATEEWLTVPWTGGHLTYFDRLVSLTTKIPGLLEQIDANRVGQPDETTLTRTKHFLTELFSVQKSLDTWRKNVKKGAGSSEVPHETQEDDFYPFDTELTFANHIFVGAHLIYFACSLVVTETIDDLERSLHSEDFKALESHHSTIRDDLISARQHAIDIARTIRYCLQSEMGALGASMINFPGNLAFRFFRRCHDARVLIWMTKVFQDMETRGFQYDQPLVGSPLGRIKSICHDGEMATDKSTERYYVIKREGSSEEGSDASTSPGSAGSSESSITTLFIYEDPSKYYIDSSEVG